MMDEEKFWRIIDESRSRACKVKHDQGVDFMDIHEQTLAQVLQELSPETIVDFQEQFYRVRDLAYRWDLWGAAYWLHGGCSDDGFIDFRSCLISLGKELFFQILDSPDSMADVVDRPDIPYMQSEGFQYVAPKTYEKKTGREFPWDEISSGSSRKPAGDNFDFDDDEEMRKRYPRLVAKLPEMGD